MSVIHFIKKQKLFFIILVVLILFLLGRSILLKNPETELTYTVEKGTLIDTIQVSGTYRTAAQTNVYSSAKGILTQLFVANNDIIRKGDQLFHVESTATDEEKAAAFADYQNAVSALKIAEQNKEKADATMWTKQQAVLDSQDDVNYKNDNTTNPTTGDDYTDLEKQSIESALIQARKDFTAAEKAYKEADIAVAAEHADLAEAKLALDATKDITVKAPAHGRIVNLQIQAGDQVSPEPSPATAQTISSQRSTPVLVIADFANPAITVAIDEAYIPRIREGQTATIVFDALKEQTFTGSVQNLDAVGLDTNGIVTYTARIHVNDLPEAIRPNMTALVTIETIRKDDIIAVPNSALFTRDGKLSVKKAHTDPEEVIEVTRGIKGSVKSEITSGLAPGTVISANAGIE